MAKEHRLGGLYKTNVLSHSSGGWKFEIKLSAVLVVGQNLLQDSVLGWQKAIFSLCPHYFPVCVLVSKFPTFKRITAILD